MLETERLLLRNYKNSDFKDFHEYISKPEVVRYEPYGPFNKSNAMQELRARCSNPEFIAIERKSDKKVIGNLYLGRRDYDARELGFVLNSSCWHQGYAQEACRSVIDDSFAHGIHRIYAQCDPENTASWKLLERLGFEREGHLKQNLYFKVDRRQRPVWKDTYIYGLLNHTEKTD